MGSDNQKILFIGHRIQDLGGFTRNKLQSDIIEEINKIIRNHKKNNPIILSTLNLGIETWSIDAAWNNRLRYHIYIPFENPHLKWPISSRKTYKELIKHSSKKLQIGKGSFDFSKIKECYQQMIDDADVIYGFFSKKTFPLDLAEAMNKKVINIMPKEDADDSYFISI